MVVAETVIGETAHARDKLGRRIPAAMARHRAASLVFVLVLFCGASLRLVGTNWDEGKHLHPDDRFLSIVADNLQWPSDVREYLNVERSPLSPYNNEYTKAYVY